VKVTESFRDAEALAAFANLDLANLDPLDSANVTNFRNNYPNFAPSEWWDYPARGEGARVILADDIDKIRNDPNFKSKLDELSKGVPQWRYAQDYIQQVWKAGFNLLNASGVSDLLNLVFYTDRSDLIWNSSQVLSPNGIVYVLNTKLYDFHKAVLYLQQHPKQAKMCKNKKCRKYFVHVHGKREFCEYPDTRGETCRHKNDNKRRLDYYYETGKKKRQVNMRKGSPRLPGSRRKKAVAKT
jgi:hypothetical protein